jgi:hypothetical protein
LPGAFFIPTEFSSFDSLMFYKSSSLCLSTSGHQWTQNRHRTQEIGIFEWCVGFEILVCRAPSRTGSSPIRDFEIAEAFHETERGQPCPRELSVRPNPRGHGCPRSAWSSFPSAFIRVHLRLNLPALREAPGEAPA